MTSRVSPKPTAFAVSLLLALGAFGVAASSFQPAAARSAPQSGADAPGEFVTSVKPFLETYCYSCHRGSQPAAGFDLTVYDSQDSVVGDPRHWNLVLTRLKRSEEALAELRLAAEIEPERARYTYVYAVALNSAGRREEAVVVLKQNLLRHPADRDTLLALISWTREAEDFAAALEYAEQLARLAPEDASVRALVENLRRQTKQSESR